MMKRVILASNSPRRRELLGIFGFDFDIIADNTPECVEDNLTPEEIVRFLAEFKGNNVISTLDSSENAVVISADTVVAVNNTVLGKPKDAKEAEEMLLLLSDNVHTVYTGVCVKDICTKKSVVFCEKTEVFFKKLDIMEIKDYINTGESMDKAGAYGIQNRGALFVKKICGDYFNVVGLPVCRLGEVLKKDFELYF